MSKLILVTTSSCAPCAFVKRTIMNYNITQVEVVDAKDVPELVKEKGIKSVPTLILEDGSLLQESEIISEKLISLFVKDIGDISNNVYEWAKEKDLHNSTIEAQFSKLVEEYAEVLIGIAKNNIVEIKDGIGDMLVVLTVMSSIIEESIVDIIEDGRTSINAVEYDNASTLRKSASLGINIYSISDYIENPENYKLVRNMVGLVHKLDLLAKDYDTSLEECYDLAYQEIKHRTGKTVDGVFVKD